MPKTGTIFTVHKLLRGILCILVKIYFSNLHRRAACYSVVINLMNLDRYFFDQKESLNLGNNTLDNISSKKF